MKVTINKRPIKITDEPMESKEISYPYLITTMVGYGMIMWIVDYVCSIFFFTHPLPLIHKIGDILLWFL